MSIVSELSIEDKRVFVDIIERLRFISVIGLIEARDWIELIFPEFAEVRDGDSDLLFLRMAQLQSGEPENDNLPE